MKRAAIRVSPDDPRRVPGLVPPAGDRATRAVKAGGELVTARAEGPGETVSKFVREVAP